MTGGALPFAEYMRYFPLLVLKGMLSLPDYYFFQGTEASRSPKTMGQSGSTSR